MDFEGLLVVVYIADIAKQVGVGEILLVIVWCVLLMIPFQLSQLHCTFFIQSSYREFNVKLSDHNMFLEFYICASLLVDPCRG